MRTALASTGVDPASFAARRLDRLVSGAGAAGRPWLLGVRNSLRRRARTALTLGTLAAAGALFISALSFRASMMATLDRLFGAGTFDSIERYAFDQHMLMIYDFLIVVAFVLWLAHCYGMVGAGRGDTLDASGTELYVVIGHSPRHLDRNVTLLGRVVQGMELLSPLPRGTGPMGFYAEGQELPSIRSVRVAADLPEAQRLHLEALRTDTPTFQALIEARRNRRESWFVNKAGKIDLCNVPLPVRLQPTPSAASH